MKSTEKGMSRRKTIKKLIEGSAFVGMGGLLWGAGAETLNTNELALRPPGASSKDKKFVGSCIKCGQCVEACPYDSVKLAKAGDKISLGTPFIKPREVPCYLCTDYPCVKACPSGALEEKRLVKKDNQPRIENSQIGLAVIHKETCIAYWGIQCDACYRVCPLIDEAITLQIDKNEVTNKHANLKPVVNSDKCTGCGICEHSCVTEKAAIFVLPRKLAMGETGNHYLKSWEDTKEKDIPASDEKNKDNDIESALEYLNSDDITEE